MYIYIYIMGNVHWLRELSMKNTNLTLQKYHFPANNYIHSFGFLLHYFLFHLNTLNPLVNKSKSAGKNSLHPKMS